MGWRPFAVAESLDRRRLFVGEVKLRVDSAGLHRTAKALKSKVNLLPFAEDYDQVLTGVFVVQSGPKSIGTGQSRTKSKLITGRQILSVLK